MKKILIVDDEIDIASSIQYVLGQEGFATSIATDGNQALKLTQSDKPDLVVLDLMMPGLDGYEVCRKIREQDTKIPILMLTARTSEIDTVVGLELGANDYIAKPVRLRELVARVKAHLRDSQGRKGGKGEQKVVLGELDIDLDSRTVTIAGKVVELTYKEFELLVALSRQPNRVFSRDQLFAQVGTYCSN